MSRLSIAAIRKDLADRRDPPALTAAGMGSLPASLRRFFGWIIRNKAVTCEQVAGFLGESEEEARSLVSALSEQGLIEHVPTCGVPVYRVCLIPRTLRTPVELLRMLEE